MAHGDDSNRMAREIMELRAAALEEAAMIAREVWVNAESAGAETAALEIETGIRTLRAEAIKAAIANATPIPKDEGGER